MESAIFAGGCFWCTEPVFHALRGVVGVEPGYCGGHVEAPTYEQVCRQDTGHVEAVRITYDPALVSYETLCRVFFGTHDPTTPDRQGNDVGPQYASVIFYQGNAQHATAEKVMHDAQAEIDAPICTRIEPAPTFWPAETYHRQYYQQHPEQGYCQFVIAPKMAKFRKHFAQLLDTPA